MKTNTLLLLFTATATWARPLPPSLLSRETGMTKKILDEMAHMHGIPEGYDPALWMRVVDCMNARSNANVDMLDQSDYGWEGFLVYGRSNGTESDPWGVPTDYIEWNQTPLSYDNFTIPGAIDILINEPCNYVSNAAYYRTMIAMCDHKSWSGSEAMVTGLAQAYNALSMGSAFFHGSGTRTGNRLDNTPIKQLAFIAHQNAVSRLPYSPVLTDISETPREKTAIASAEELALMLINESVYDWQGIVDAMDLPNYYISFGCTVDAVLNMALPYEIAHAIVEIAAGLFLSDDEAEFILEKFEPEFVTAMQGSGVQPTVGTKAELLFRGVGTVIKMLWAFVWQENLIPGPHLTDPEANLRGAELMPVVNALGNDLANYPHLDQDIQDCINVYPGDATCRVEFPHAKWHEQGANALVDLMWLCDDIDYIFSGQQLEWNRDYTKIECLVNNQCFSDFTFDEIELPTPGTIALTKCLPVLLESWPEPDIAGFLVCMVEALNITIDIPEEVVPDALGICLIQNDCIVVDPESGLDLGVLIDCVQRVPITNPNPPCEDYIDTLRIAPCVLGCGDDILCVVSCAQKYATLSPFVNAAATCLPELVGDEPDLRGFLQCVVALGPFPVIEYLGDNADLSPYPFLTAILNGMPKLLDCSQNVCAPGVSSFLRSTGSQLQCARSCISHSSSIVFDLFEGRLPMFASCFLECHLEDRLNK